MKHFPGLADFVSKELFAGIVTNSHDMIVIANHQRAILFVNNAACKKTGYKAKELFGKKLLYLCSGVRRASYTSKMSAALREGNVWTEEVEIVRKDGTTFLSNITVTQCCNENKKVPGFVCVIHDLTDSLSLAQYSWKSESALQHIIDSILESLYVIDSFGKILMCNDAHEKILGFRKNKIIGLAPPYPWVSNHDQARINHLLSTLRKDGTLNNFIMPWQRKNGTTFLASLNGARLKSNSSRGKQFVITVRDVSSVPYVDEYRRANERFEMLNSEIKRKAVVLNVLNEINCFVLHNAEIDKVLKTIVDGVKLLVEHDLAGFYLYDPSQQVLVPHTVSKQTPFSRKLAKLPLPFGQGIIGVAAASGTLVLANNAQMDPRSRYPEGMKPKIEHFVAVPMKGRDVLFGVLVVSRNSNPEFVEEEAKLIELFANSAGVALENARLFSTVATLNTEKEARNVMEVIKRPFLQRSML